jgi:hypothetical protein
MIFLIPVIGLLCTTLILFWLYPNQVKTGKLSDLYSADSVRTLAGLDPKSLDYKLLAAGLKLRPVTFRGCRRWSSVGSLSTFPAPGWTTKSKAGDG